nr:LysE family translocator [Cereibacter changlensis]
MVTVSVGAAAAIGPGSQVAVAIGGAIALARIDSDLLAELGSGATVNLANEADLGIHARNEAQIVSVGLGAAVAAAPWLFEAIRWVGVGYLLWLAWATLRAGPGVALPEVRPARAFREGLVVNLTNPKVILFVLAFVPQFVDPAHPVLPQFLVFGLILSVGGLVVNGLVGVFAGGVGRRLVGSPGFGRWLGRASAAIFVGLAARLALMQRG